MNQPQRRFHFTLDVQSDDMKSLLNVLSDIARQGEQERLSRSCFSGGYDSGYYWTLSENADQTHDKYIDELNTYLAAQRAKEPS